jgi:hypothetical protein
MQFYLEYRSRLSSYFMVSRAPRLAGPDLAGAQELLENLSVKQPSPSVYLK